MWKFLLWLRTFSINILLLHCWKHSSALNSPETANKSHTRLHHTCRDLLHLYIPPAIVLALSWHFRARSYWRGSLLLPQPGSECSVWAQQALPQPWAALRCPPDPRDCTEPWWSRSDILRCPVPALLPAAAHRAQPLGCLSHWGALWTKEAPTRPHHSWVLLSLLGHTLCKAHLHHPITQRIAQGKKLEMQLCGVYSALQVSFATSCLPRTEKSQTPTRASMISMREKLGVEMGARSLDIFPHTHSFALNIQEFKPVPSKKICILGNGSSTVPQFNPCYIFLLKEKSKREKKNYIELNIWQK